jgi:hypothetical protein
MNVCYDILNVNNSNIITSENEIQASNAPNACEK